MDQINVPEVPECVLDLVARACTAADPAARALEAFLRQYVPALPNAIDAHVKAFQHPLSKELPLMDFYLVLLISLSYLVVIAFLRLILPMIRPSSGASKSGALRVLMILHNIGLILLSAYMAVATALEAYKSGYSVWGNDVSNSRPMAKLIWIFYLSKIWEFADTAFMLAKRNYNQVSVLHVYHHSSIFIIWWLVTSDAPGGDSYFSAAQNAAVHVIMYSYYLKQLLFPPAAKQAPGKGLRAKHLITLLQLTQFAVNLAQGWYMWRMMPAGCTFPSHLGGVLFFYMITMLALFMNFLLADSGAARKGAKKQKTA